MRRVVKSEWYDVENLGHGYRLEHFRKYDDGHMSHVTYFLWNRPDAITGRTGHKHFWPYSDRQINLPKAFQDYLRAYAMMKLS
jgi:hypothetical protein